MSRQTSAIERTLAEHGSILQAIASRQPEAARSWWSVHIDGVEQWLRETFAEIPQTVRTR